MAFNFAASVNVCCRRRFWFTGKAGALLLRQNIDQLAPAAGVIHIVVITAIAILIASMVVVLMFNI